MLAERLAEDGPGFASGWNFGPADADAKPVSWIAEKLARSWGNDAAWNQDAAPHPREAHFLKLDASRAKACLEWEPMLPLEQALEWIVEWYRAFQRGADLRRLTLEQIERYESLSSNFTSNRATASGVGPPADFSANGRATEVRS